MHGHFAQLLGAAVAEPEAQLNALEMLTDAEKAQQQFEEQELMTSNSALLKNVRRKSMKASLDAAA
jgi:hypothetical protein